MKQGRSILRLNPLPRKCQCGLRAFKKTLAGAWRSWGGAVATRTTLPITQNVLIETDQGRLKLSATNLELAVTTWVGGEVQEEGSVTIPARLLTDFVNSLPSDRVEMEMTTKPLGVRLKCARFEANINGTAAEEFPPITHGGRGHDRPR